MDLERHPSQPARVRRQIVAWVGEKHALHIQPDLHANGQFAAIFFEHGVGPLAGSKGRMPVADFLLRPGERHADLPQARENLLFGCLHNKSMALLADCAKWKCELIRRPAIHPNEGNYIFGKFAALLDGGKAPRI